MSAMAHPAPGSFALPMPRRRRHLALVPAPESGREQVADVIALPVPAAPRLIPARPGARPRMAGAAVASSPLRLTVRGRRVLATLLLLATGAIGAVAGTMVGASTAPTAVETVTVGAGESLWSIASEVAAPGADVRDVMSQIASLNALESTMIVAGQELVVPVTD